MPTRSEDAPVWHCDAGTVIGWRDGEVLRATGIRYASSARYQPPVATPSGSGQPPAQPIEATKWSAACPQPPVPLLEAVLPRYLGDLPFDENCQLLSVTVPREAEPGSELPVMVWIHGGSYVSGAGDAPIYDAAALVSEQQVIVVNVTYRLGLFGYLGGASSGAANLGLLDQIEALKWVQRNIEAFGGDRANVTVFGQSAGGDAAAHLMISDGAEGLFSRAIIQSSPFGILLKRAGMSLAMMQTADQISPDSTAAEVAAAQAGVAQSAQSFGLRAAMPFGTQYGFAPLPPESQIDKAWAAAASRIDVMVGCTNREVALFTTGGRVTNIPDVPVLGSLIRTVIVAVMTRKIYGAGVRSFAKRHARGGGHGYRYRLSWGAPNNPYAGAHTIELPLLFGNRKAWEGISLIKGASWDQVDEQGRALRRIWAGFARDGNVAATNVPGPLKIRKI